MTKEPQNLLVSFIVPLFNNEDFLLDCLLSILRQSHKCIEILIIDDNSVDSSPEIARTFTLSTNRARVIKHHQRLGAGQARNTGLLEAKGKYVRFVDADDIIPPQSTSQLLERAHLAKAQLVRGSLYTFQGSSLNRPVIDVSVPDVHQASPSVNRELCIPWWHTSYLYDRCFLIDNKITYPSLSIGEDPVFLATCISKASSISLIPEYVYLYRKYSKASGSASVLVSALKDQLTHYSYVKNLHQRTCPSCWDCYYSEIGWNNYQGMLKRARLSSAELKTIEEIAKTIWPRQVSTNNPKAT